MIRCIDHNLTICKYCQIYNNVCLLNDRYISLQLAKKYHILDKEFIMYQMNAYTVSIYWRKAVELICPEYLEFIDKMLLIK